jgi:hypothetical protein
MRLSSAMHGEHSSDVEVTNISSHGFWLLANGSELFLSYEDFPWFKDVPVGQIIDVEQPSPGHFRWPQLDVDLGTDTIENPDRFPLKAT